MFMTELLYYKNQYLKETKAKVLEASGKNILLDRTIFFPQSAGEPGDAGKINGMRLSGLKKEGDDVIHILEKQPAFSAGDEISLALDYDKRLKSMRLHSALHLLAGIIETKFGERAVAGNVKTNEAQIVLKSELQSEKINEAAEEANKIIQAGAEIKTYWDEKREGFRWCKIRAPAMPLSTLCDLPPIPCGGLHVKTAKEIGKIKIGKIENEHGKQKIVIKVE